MDNGAEVIDILSGILRYDAVYELEEPYVEVPVENPMDDSDRVFFRYKAAGDDSVQVEQWIDGSLVGSVTKRMRDIVWKICRLERVCATYRKQYERWKLENSGIPYLETNINDESDGRPQRSYEYMRNFWTKKPLDNGVHQNLRLLLAEYGVGKSSYCNGIRRLVADEIKGSFLEGQAAFPFVFDLNEFRSGSIDKYIESEMFNKYDVAISYRIFEKLCQNGIFMVVLDAWDQMRDTRQIVPINRDLSQLSALWDKQGKALITCRRSFYQQQLKGKDRGRRYLSQNAGLYKLTGFDKESVKEYFRRDSEECRQKGNQAVLPDVDVWVEEGWKLNSKLLAKPLNLKLLVQHYDAISRQIDLCREKADTYHFLGIILGDWEQKHAVKDEKFLKELVSQTLYAGLNRSIPLEQLREACDVDKWNEIITSLRSFDFVRIDDKEERIEFCLAAYQEFLWAHFALEELKTPPDNLNGIDALIRNYFLIREVREWICKELGKKDIIQKELTYLIDQLEFVKYRKKEEVGYRGSNALTLLCDLNRISYYKKQFQDIKSNLRRSPLMGTDFRGIDLSGADFYNSDLSGADFSYTKLDGVRFSYANLAQTMWREHERMTKCAFLIQSDVLCVVAATKSGGLITYRVNDGEREIFDIQNDVINDLAGDRGGIYTASSDGWVGYMDKNGNLRNAYIAESGLQSITYTNNEDCVYVGADNQGIFRYNWHTGSKQEVVINEPLGSRMDRISDIHYYSNTENEDYIAYTLSNRRLLVLLKLEERNRGQVKAKCHIDTERYCFGDICFADDMLIYTVIGKGIYGMLVDEVIDEIPERELLHERQRLLSLPQAETVALSWANESKVLMAVSMSEGESLGHIHAIDVSSGVSICSQIEIDWLWEERIYRMNSEQVGGFSVSGDGRYAAFSGDFLAVFKMDVGCYSLIDRPIEAKITCRQADFSNAKSMNLSLIRFVEEHEAIFKREEEER